MHRLHNWLPRLLNQTTAGSLLVTALLLAGCVTSGPTVVDPDRSFKGLRDVLKDLDPKGELDVFLVHGMRADQVQQYQDVISALTPVLAISEIPHDDASLHPLVPNPPTVTLDGTPVFGPGNWSQFQPQYFVQTYKTVDGKTVRFYGLQYWEALAYLKCRYVIAPDALVIGNATWLDRQFVTPSRLDYCNAAFSTLARDALSTKPEVVNWALKSEIMEWGLSDAVIATSSYRVVLQQAIRELFGLAWVNARAVAGLPGKAEDVSVQDELQNLWQQHRFRIAFISASLGSYVVHDTLDGSVRELAQIKAGGPKATDRDPQHRIEEKAPSIIVCGASQVHMLANQIALLQLSELNVTGVNAAPTGRVPDFPSLPLQPDQSKFFRGCGPEPVRSDSEKGVAFAAHQTVAYHDPNDLLSYYLSDRPGTVGSDNTNSTNVVVPFTGIWVWFLAANAITAHTGQGSNQTIETMVACGRKASQDPTCN